MCVCVCPCVCVCALFVLWVSREDTSEHEWPKPTDRAAPGVTWINHVQFQSPSIALVIFAGTQQLSPIFIEQHSIQRLPSPLHTALSVETSDCMLIVGTLLGACLIRTRTTQTRHRCTARTTHRAPRNIQASRLTQTTSWESLS